MLASGMSASTVQQAQTVRSPPLESELIVPRRTNLPIKPGMRDPGTIARWILAISTLAFLIVVLERCRHGLDFTDEGFYLNWIHNPWLYPFSVTQFGFIYFPLFRALDSDIVLLRQANVLITFVLAQVLMFAILRGERRWLSSGWLTDCVLAFSLALPGLFYLLQWIATPGYNSLVLQGLLVTGIGIVTGQRQATAGAGLAALAPAIILGLGGWLVLLGKPTSAALLAPAALVATLATAQRKWRTLLLAAGTSLTFIAATVFYIDGSITAFAERIQVGATAAFEHSPSYGVAAMLSWGKHSTTVLEKLIFVAATTGSVGLLLLAARQPFAGAAGALVASLVVAAFAAVLVARPDLLAKLPRLRLDSAVLVGAVPLGVLIAGLVLGGREVLASEKTRKMLVVAAVLVICPYLFAVGTNTVVAQRAMWAMVFVAAAGVLAAQALLRPRLARHASLLVAAGALPVTAALLTASMEKPYRNTVPLRQQTTGIDVGPAPSTRVLVDSETARYLTELRQALLDGGGGDGTPVLDMTGASPGAIFGIGAKAIGLPWMIGGYPGSAALATRALTSVTCAEKAATWLLLSPTAKRALPQSVLAGTGLEANRVTVAQIRDTGDFIQELEKPSQAAAAAECSNN